MSSGPFRNAGHSRPAGPITVKSDRIRSLMAGRGSFLARRWLGGGKGASKSRKKRLCRLMCGKPLAFRRRQPPSSPRLGWKAQPSSRAVGVGHGGSPRKGEAFPHSRRQSRFGMLPFGDFERDPVGGAQVLDFDLVALRSPTLCQHFRHQATMTLIRFSLGA